MCNLKAVKYIKLSRPRRTWHGPSSPRIACTTRVSRSLAAYRPANSPSRRIHWNLQSLSLKLSSTLDESRIYIWHIYRAVVVRILDLWLTQQSSNNSSWELTRVQGLIQSFVYINCRMIYGIDLTHTSNKIQNRRTKRTSHLDPNWPYCQYPLD